MSSRKHKQRERFLTHQGGTPLMPRKGKERCYKKVKLKTNKPQRKPSILSDEIKKTYTRILLREGRNGTVC